MIPNYDDLDRYKIELFKLIDHIATGAPDYFFVYAPNESKAFGSDYQAALAYFNSVNDQGYTYMALATRIGTASVILEKTVP